MRKALRIFGILSDSDVGWIKDHAEVSSVSAHTVLIHEGVPIDSLYIVMEGEFSVTVGTPAKHVATLLAGEIVGEISFVDSRNPVASVTAAVDSHVLVISKPLLVGALEADAGFSSRFYRAIAAYLADRLHVTVGRFGYGNPAQDVDELNDDSMEEVSLGAMRMNFLLRQAGTGIGIKGQ